VKVVAFYTMGAEMCTGVRNLTIEDSNLNVKEIFSDSICYRKLDRRRIRKKVRKLERKVQEYKLILEQQKERKQSRKLKRNATRRNLQ
jgi:hypothetical protein